MGLSTILCFSLSLLTNQRVVNPGSSAVRELGLVTVGSFSFLLLFSFKRRGGSHDFVGFDGKPFSSAAVKGGL